MININHLYLISYLFPDNDRVKNFTENPKITYDIVCDLSHIDWYYPTLTGNPNITYDIIQNTPHLSLYADNLRAYNKPSQWWAFYLMLGNPNMTIPMLVEYGLRYGYIINDNNHTDPYDIMADMVNSYSCNFADLALNPDIVNNNMIRKVRPNNWIWFKIVKNPAITWEIIQANPDIRWFDSSYIWVHPCITWEIIQTNPDIIWDFRYLSANPNITWDIIKANPNKSWDYNELCWNPNITWDIIQSNPNISWNYSRLSQNLNITWEIIQNNPGKRWCYEGFSRNPNLTWHNVYYNQDKPWNFEQMTFNLFDNHPVIRKRLISKYYYNKWKQIMLKHKKERDYYRNNLFYCVLHEFKLKYKLINYNNP